MKYLILKNNEELKKKVEEYCEQHDITFVDIKDKTVYVAFDGDKVCGLIGMRNVVTIEPLIADNALVANSLFRMAEGVILNEGIDIVRFFTDKKNEELFNKENFNKVFDDKIIMEKHYGWSI